jgi:hypothetical protein
VTHVTLGEAACASSLRAALCCLAVCCLAGCATLRATTSSTPAELAERAARCEHFSDFEAELRDANDALLASATGEALMSGNAALSGARRTCARAVLGSLLERREASGTGAVQAELDAMAQSLRGELRALAREVLGVAARELEPLLAEALSHGTRATPLPTAQQPTGHEVPLGCQDQPDACRAAACLAGEPDAASAAVEAAARGCLDVQRARPAALAAPAIAALVAALASRAQSGASTEALVQLEGLRRQQWPRLEAVRSSQPALAAELATPFLALGSAKGAVTALRADAVRTHLALAQASVSQPGAAQLHRLVAARFGGPAEPPLEPRPGRWSPARWGCAWEQPQLPEPFPGVELKLEATCREAPVRASTADRGELATFDLEHELSTERVEATLRATCAERTFSFSFTVKGEVFGGSAGRGERVSAELEQQLLGAQRACEAWRVTQERQDCEAPGGVVGPAPEQRFVERFVLSGRWPACFVDGFTRRYGVPPPAPRSELERLSPAP